MDGRHASANDQPGRAGPDRDRRGHGGPIALIGAASLLNVTSGVILKEAGQLGSLWVIPLAIGAAGIVNLLRFLLWQRAHRLYPLSLTYPLTGLTFPIALGVSTMYREPIGPRQLAAALLISVGVVLIHRSEAFDEEH